MVHRIILPAALLGLAFAASASAATLSVGAGNTTYSGDVCGIYASNLTIRGVNGRPKIDANGKNAMGKGIWVVARPARSRRPITAPWRRVS